MRVFLTGATGFLGARVAVALRGWGHDVHGLARSETAARQLAERGISVVHGDLNDISTLRDAVQTADATICCAQLTLEQERAVTDALVAMLAGTGKTLIATSGTGVFSRRTDGDWSDECFAEDDDFVPWKVLAARVDTERAVLGSAACGIRAMVVRPPMIWGHGGSGLIGQYYRTARSGAVCYVGRGLNVFTNVHVDDLAELYALALEKGVAGALYHAAGGEESFRSIANTVARTLNLPARSVDMDEMIRILGKKDYGVVAMAMCSRSRSPRTRQELGWVPVRLDVLEEAANSSYRKVF